MKWLLKRFAQVVTYSESFSDLGGPGDSHGDVNV